jgi:hypothetical protein
MSEEITLMPRLVWPISGPHEVNGQLIHWYEFEAQDGKKYKVAVPDGWVFSGQASEAA